MNKKDILELEVGEVIFIRFGEWKERITLIDYVGSLSRKKEKFTYKKDRCAEMYKITRVS